MTDLEQSVRHFQASARLQRASNALEALAVRGEPDANTVKVLQWAGEFLTEMDLETPASTASGALAVEATTARPTYYMSLARLRPQFEEVGVRTQSEFMDFLLMLFAALKAGGEGDIKIKRTPERVRLGARLLREMSNSLLAQNDVQTASVIR